MAKDGYRLMAMNPLGPDHDPVEVTIPLDLVRRWYKKSSVDYRNLETAKAVARYKRRESRWRRPTVSEGLAESVWRTAMGKHFLSDLVAGEAEGFAAEPWYNRHGDSIVFKAENVAVVADRIDDILTLYRSAEDDQIVGFKLKGIAHLAHKARCNAVAVTGKSDGTDFTVSLAFLLLTAYDEGARTVNRRWAYAEAQDAARRTTEPDMTLEAITS